MVLQSCFSPDWKNFWRFALCQFWSPFSGFSPTVRPALFLDLTRPLQAKMLDMLKQTGRPEMVVGWYHRYT